jgi:hypothetical protein
MKKEKVIIFEGEQNFVIPKNRVRNKKTGVSYYVPDDMNVVGVDKSGITPIDESQLDAPKEPDEPIRIITPPPSGSSDISVRNQGGSGGGGTLSTKPLGNPVTTMGTLPPSVGEPNIQLGNPTKQFPSAGEELVTPITPVAPSTPVAPITPTIPIVPIDTIVSTSKMGGGIGGGGGGSKEGASAPKKTFLQKYWWLLLLVAAGGGYYYYKKKNK